MDMREFQNADLLYAPSLIWDWCAKPTAQEIDSCLYKFSEMRISEVFIRPSNGLVLPYLSDDYFELIRTAARRSAKYNIALWICDENSPHSGHGGGEITSVGDYRMRAFLKCGKNDVHKTDIVLSEDGCESIVLRDFSLVPASKKPALPNITDPFVTECFTSHVYDRYIAQCKRFIGCEIRGFMTQINIPDGVLYHSPSALSLAGASSPEEGGKKLLSENDDFKSIYTDAFSSLISDSYTAQIQKKCSDNQMKLYSFVCAEPSLSRQMQYIKSDLISLSTDALCPDLVEFKLAQTISEQFGKPLMARPLLPLFSSSSQRHDVCTFFIAMGAEKICYDSVAFSLSDRRKYEEHTLSLSTLSEKDISDRLSRLSRVGAQSKNKADILVIYDPSQKSEYTALCEKLLHAGVDFHMVESLVYEKFARINEETISCGDMTYTCVIAPLSADLRSFGGRVITLSDAFEHDFSDIGAEFKSDKEVFINKRTDESSQYIFITAGDEDTTITFQKKDTSLFVTDTSNGELYALPFTDEECTFTLKKGKTVLLIYAENVHADIMPPMTDEVIITPLTTIGTLDFVLASAEENILPLKNVRTCFGRKSYPESSIDSLHKEFYSLPDNETVKVKYPFTVSLADVGEVFAYIENADNLDFAEINGKPLSGFVPSAKDPRFMGVNITPFLSDGKNTFALEYKKSNNYKGDFSSITPAHFYSYNITSFEPVYLCGDFDCTVGALVPPMPRQNDISLSGMPYYYGPLTYNLLIPEDENGGSLLRINGDFDICRVKIGRRERVFFSQSPLMEIFGIDALSVAEITVFNTPYNLFRTSGKEAKPFGITSIELCKF